MYTRHEFSIKLIINYTKVRQAAGALHTCANSFHGQVAESLVDGIWDITHHVAM